MAARDASAERAALADEVLLADELVEDSRAHPGGQRLPLGRWLEERFGSGARGRRAGGMAAMVARRRAGSRLEPSPIPVTWMTAQAPIRSAISEPPMRAIRGCRGPRRRTRWRPRPRACRPLAGRTSLRAFGLRRRLGGLLLGDDLRLELGGAGLRLGERLPPYASMAVSFDRYRRRPGRRRPARRPGRRRCSLDGRSLAGSGTAASGAFGHRCWRSLRRWIESTAKDSTGSRTGRRRGSAQSRDAARAPARLADAHTEALEIDLNALVGPNLGAIVVGLVIVVVDPGRRRRRASPAGHARLAARLDGITRGESGKSLEAILEAHLDKIFAVARDLDDVTARTAALEGDHADRLPARRPRPLQPVRGHRREPELRPRAARREGRRLGLSSLHARTGTRFYAKAITAGRSDTGLSEEEQAAIRQATS